MFSPTLPATLAAVTVLAVSTAQAATIHVDVANCSGPGDGTIGDPFCSIQTAIDNAAGDRLLRKTWRKP